MFGVDERRQNRAQARHAERQIAGIRKKNEKDHFSGTRDKTGTKALAAAVAPAYLAVAPECCCLAPHLQLPLQQALS